ISRSPLSAHERFRQQSICLVRAEFPNRFADDRGMRTANQLLSTWMILQERGDDSFCSVEASPKDVVLTPAFLKKGAEVSQGCARKFMTTRCAFVDQLR